MLGSCNGMINEMINEGEGRANAVRVLLTLKTVLHFLLLQINGICIEVISSQSAPASDSLTGWTGKQWNSGAQWHRVADNGQWDELAHQCNQLRHGEQQQELNLAHEKRFNNTNWATFSFGHAPMHTYTHPHTHTHMHDESSKSEIENVVDFRMDSLRLSSSWLAANVSSVALCCQSCVCVCVQLLCCMQAKGMRCLRFVSVSANKEKLPTSQIEATRGLWLSVRPVSLPLCALHSTSLWQRHLIYAARQTSRGQV